MELITKDYRPSVTVAFSVAIANNMVSSEKIATWQKEMQDLTIEVTKKFVSFATIESVRKGLRLLLGILSLPVSHSSLGSYEPETWAKFLMANGPKNLAKLALEMLGTLTKRSSVASLNPLEGRASVRDLISNIAVRPEVRGLNKKESSEWIPYAAYVKEIQYRVHAEEVEKGLKWLVEHIAKTSMKTLLNQLDDVAGFDAGNAHPELDQLINSILYCAVVGKKFPKAFLLTGDDFRYYRRRYELNPEKWLASAKSRYEALKEKAPKEHRALFLTRANVDWFEIHMALNGPEKIRTEKASDGINMSHVNAQTAYFSTM